LANHWPKYHGRTRPASSTPDAARLRVRILVRSYAYPVGPAEPWAVVRGPFFSREFVCRRCGQGVAVVCAVLWPTAVVLLVTRPSVHWACDCSGHPASAVCAAAPLTLTPSPRLPTGSRLAGIDTLCRGNARLGLQDSRLRRRCRTTSRTTPPRAVGFGAPAPRCALRACWPGASALVCVRA